MPFEWRAFELAKEPEHPDENQDAWWLNAEEGVAAIADGVTGGIFAPVARLLARAAVDKWPEPDNGESFPRWLGDLRARWEQEIDVSGLAWYQRAKLREGGFSTLLWLRLLDNGGLYAGQDQSPVEVMAIGDTCLFHVRDDRLLASFPLDQSRQFGNSPLVLGSIDLKKDGQLQFEHLEINARVGDLIVLCTDAVAVWALEQYEQGEPVPWSRYWDMPVPTWADEICRLRTEAKLRVDDATLVLLRVSRKAEGPAETGSPPAAAELPPAPRVEEEPEVDLLVVDDWGEPAPSNGLAGEAVPDEPAPSNGLAGKAVPDEPAGSPSDIYDLQLPLQPQPRAESPPPPLPPLGVGVPPPLPPPPAPPASPDQNAPGDWRDQVSSISERIFKKVTEKLSRGADMLQEAKDSAVKKVREKIEGKSIDDGPDQPGR